MTLKPSLYLCHYLIICQLDEIGTCFWLITTVLRPTHRLYYWYSWSGVFVSLENSFDAFRGIIPCNLANCHESAK